MFERFTERSRQVVTLAQDEARALKHNYIGTEHILLGLVRENEGVASCILLDYDLDAVKIRNEVIRAMSGPKKSDPDLVINEALDSIRLQLRIIQEQIAHRG